MTTTAHRLPMILTEVTVTSVERISPSFVRVELSSPDLADFGVDGPLLDQRIKLVFPNASGRLASLAGADESWWSTWLDIPEDERGHMRTYSVRDVRGSGADTRVVVDLVLHLEDGATGPGSLWAATAAPGDRLLLIGPRRGEEFGGIEFDPGTARSLLLAADETAVPAACRILSDLPHTAVGAAFLEVPDRRRHVRRPGPARGPGGVAAPGRGRPRRAAGRGGTPARRAGADRGPGGGERRWTRTSGRPRPTRPRARSSTGR